MKKFQNIVIVVLLTFNFSGISVALTTCCRDEEETCQIAKMHAKQNENCKHAVLNKTHNKDANHVEQSNNQHMSVNCDYNISYEYSFDNQYNCGCEKQIVEKTIPFTDINTQKTLSLLLSLSTQKADSAIEPFLTYSNSSEKAHSNNRDAASPHTPLYYQISALLI